MGNEHAHQHNVYQNNHQNEDDYNQYQNEEAYGYDDAYNEAKYEEAAYSDEPEEDEMGQHNQGSAPTCASFATAYVISELLKKKNIRIECDIMAKKIATLMGLDKGNRAHKIIKKMNDNYKKMQFPDCDGQRFYKLKLSCDNKILHNEIKTKDYVSILKKIKKYHDDDTPIYGAYEKPNNTFGGANHFRHAVAVANVTDTTKYGKIKCINSWGNTDPYPNITPAYFYYFAEIKIVKVVEVKAGGNVSNSTASHQIIGGETYCICDKSGVLAVTATSRKADKDVPMEPKYIDKSGFTKKQKFTFEPVPDEVDVYYIKNNYSGHYLDIPHSSHSDGEYVIQWPLHGGPNQQWEVIPRGNGCYQIENVNSGKYLKFKDGMLKQYSSGGSVFWIKAPEQQYH